MSDPNSITEDPSPEDNSDAPQADLFLIRAGGDVVLPASVNQGAWDRVLADQHLTQEKDLTVLHKLPTEASDGQLLFTWKPTDKAGQQLATYQFSSERNSSYFLSSRQDGDQLKNTAGVGDSGHSGVMLLRPSGAGELGLLDVILPMFSIEPSASDPKSPISVLLAALKPADTTKSFLTASLKPVADWKSSNGKDLDTPLQLTSNDRSLNFTNGIWCSGSGSQYSVTITLSYRLHLNLASISAWLSDNLGGLKPKFFSGADANAAIDADLTLSKTTLYDAWPSTPDPPALNGHVMAMLSIQFHLGDFDLHLDIANGSIQALLIPRGTGTITSMLQNAFDGSTGDVDMIPSTSSSNNSFSAEPSFSSLYLWYVGLGLTFDTPAKVSWEFGLLTTLSINNDQKVVVALSYDSRSKTFVGRTIFALDLPSSKDVRVAGWDPRLDPAAVLADKGVLEKMPESIDIFALLGLSTTESMIPSPKLLNAQVTFHKGGTNEPTIFKIYGRFSFAEIMDELIPKEIFRWDDSAVQVEIRKSASSTDYSFSVANNFLLMGKLSDDEEKLNPKPLVPTAVLAFRLALKKTGTQKIWTLQASVRDLSVRLIESLFDKNLRDDGLEVLENLSLAALNINYTFSGNKASSLDVTGILRLGDLALDLVYSRPKDGDWHFTARLSAQSAGSTIFDIVESIIPGSSERIPEFVGNIHVDPSSANGSPLCELEFRSNDDASKGRSGILTIFLQIAGFSLTFVQYKTRAKAPQKGVVKRVLRISVDQIPMMDRIPIVGKMPQPFDHLAYMWVEDDNSKPTVKPAVDSTKLGITKTELDDIKVLMPKDIPPFQVRDATGPKSASATPMSLAKGHHFVVVVSGKVILDHVFDTTRKETASPTSQPASATISTATGVPASGNSPAPSPVAQPTKGSATTAAGPLSISALTLQYKQGSLLVSVDATLKLGPITFSVIGFTLAINLKEVKLDNLADIVNRHLIDASLHGIQVGLTQGPLTLNGVFIHDSAANYESYRGGIAVGFKAWQVLAVGEYYVHMNKGVEDYKAVFVYGKLDGPLIQLQFATISGVRVGFGYNYSIRMPDLSELGSFPLITDQGLKGAGNDPMVVLEAIRGGPRPFVTPKLDSYWFAAGMTITALETLSLTAMLIMDVDTSAGKEAGIILTMLADGVFQMAPLAPPELTLFYIELIVKVELNFVHGYIAAEATLAPSSHIYVPSAHLTGSAAFYTWFGDNPHAGDWVASIGGYPRSYQPAEWYPRPSRVGLNFTVGDNIQLIGEAYCAVTPKCAMAGGALHLSLSVGPVSAYADLTIDAFINFKPFHFRASMSITVGVECGIDILFVHIHINIHLGADLVIWGPDEFGGRAHVDFWFFGFDISFGADENSEARKPISISDFIEMTQQPGPGGHQPTEDKVGGTASNKTIHKYSVEDGLAPQGVTPASDNGDFPSTGATTTWDVLAGTLKIRIDCGFALTKATLVEADSTKNKAIQLPGNATVPDVYSWPMHCQEGEKLNSELKVTIRQADVTNTPIYDGFRAELVMKTAGTALWRKWNSQEDPLYNSVAPGNLTHAKDGTVDLVLAVRLLPPESKRSQSDIIDMDAAAAMRYTIPGTYSLPRKDTQSHFTPLYFEDKDADDNEIDGVTRWNDFKELWDPKTQTASTAEIAAERVEVVKQIVDVLEWSIRPPEQMQGNVKPMSPEERSSTVFLLAADKEPNAPRVRSNGRTDWDLVDKQPSKMVGLLDTYYPALPFVCT